MSRLTDEQRDQLIRLLGAEATSIACRQGLMVRIHKRDGLDICNVGFSSTEGMGMVRMFDLFFFYSMATMDLTQMRSSKKPGTWWISPQETRIHAMIKESLEDMIKCFGTEARSGAW